MKLVVVPNELRDAIYKKVDKALEQQPHLTPNREEIYMKMLEYYDQTGIITDFVIKPVVDDESKKIFLAEKPFHEQKDRIFADAYLASGRNARQAAAKLGIPKSTFHDWLKKKRYIEMINT